MSGDTLIGVGRLAEICMRLSARDERVVGAVLDLATAIAWGDVRADAGQAIFIQGAVASALVFGAGPLTQTACLNLLMYGEAWPFTTRRSPAPGAGLALGVQGGGSNPRPSSALRAPGRSSGAPATGEFTEEGPALFRAVTDLWCDPGVSAYVPVGRGEGRGAAERPMMVRERLIS